MSFLRQWMLGVVGCALAVSLAQQICDSESMRAAVRFVGGLALVLCMTQPLAGVELGTLETDLQTYRTAAAQREEAFRAEYEAALAKDMAQRTGAYIESRAKELGVPVRAEVCAETVDGAVRPTRATLYGAYSASLADWIEQTLGIAKERQQWMANG